MPKLSGPEIMLVVLVVLLLFGAKRLPDLARGVGKSLKIFKSEVSDLGDGDKRSTEAEPAPTATTAPPSAAPAAHAPAEPYRDPVTHAQGADDTERKQV